MAWGGKVDTILQTLRNLGTMRLVLMGGVLVGVIAFFVFLMARVATPQMALLYGDLDSADTTRITAELDGMGVQYEIRDEGRSIYVPSERVSRLRVAMAEQGLPSGGTIGYEIFDDSGSIGTTNFVQNVNLVRALEGELARTIAAIDSVRSARVHLVMPQRQLFSRERQEPSASVILKMRGAIRLDREQVSAIQHLVAAAVPRLSPNRISIVDGRGSLLARGFEEEDDVAAMAAKADERRRTYETRLARTIEEMIEQAVGYGKVRAEVRADMDFDRISTSEEQFDPDGRVMRSTQTLEETLSSSEAEQLPVTVANNLPDGQPDGGEGASASTSENRVEETVNYEISKKVINHVREAGVVRRLSVAVLVDGTYNVGENGQRVYEPREKEEMDQIANLVRGAIGFESERGDSLEVINMQFASEDEGEADSLVLFFGLDKNDLLRMAEFLVLVIVALLVILLIVRPLVTRAFEAVPAASTGGGDGRLLSDERMDTPALTGPSDRGEDDEDFEDLIDIDRVEGRVKASSVKKVGEIVDKHPGEALAIVRSWMYQEG